MWIDEQIGLYLSHVENPLIKYIYEIVTDVRYGYRGRVISIGVTSNVKIIKVRLHRFPDILYNKHRIIYTNTLPDSVKNCKLRYDFAETVMRYDLDA